MARIYGIGLALLVGLSSAPVMGEPGAYSWLQGGKLERVEIRVRHGDLDLNRPEDAARLRARLREVASRVCREDDRPPIVLQLRARECIREAERSARAQIEHALAEGKRAKLAAHRP